TAKDWARLKTNYCFAASPGPSSVDSVTRGNERIIAVTGNTTDSPYRAAEGAGSGGRGPCRNASWIIYRHSHQPAMVKVAIPHAPIPDIKNFGVAHDSQRRSLLLDRRSEGRAVVLSRHLHVHRPARIDGARVHVKGNDVMFYGRSAIGRDHCVQKQRPRSKIDDGRADDP